MEIEGVITIKSPSDELQAIVFTDLKKHSQVFYKCVEMNQDDVKELLTPKQRND